MSTLAAPYERPVESGGEHWRQWFQESREERSRPMLTLIEMARDGREAPEELSNGDPPPLVLWGEE